LENIREAEQKKDHIPTYAGRRWDGNEILALVITVMTGVLVVVAVANDLRVLP
jgi:hypothetical protein